MDNNDDLNMDKYRMPKPLPKIPKNLVTSKDILYDSSYENSKSESDVEKPDIKVLIGQLDNQYISSTKSSKSGSDLEKSDLEVSIKQLNSPSISSDKNIINKNGYLSPIPSNSIQPLRPQILKKRHHQYIIVSEDTRDAKELCLAIRGEHHMHVRAGTFISIVTDNDVIIMVTTPKTVANHCKIMNSLIKSQKGRAVCVCIIPKLTRMAIVEVKEKMIDLMEEDHIVFAAYDNDKLPELTNLEKFWRDVDGIINFFN